MEMKLKIMKSRMKMTLNKENEEQQFMGEGEEGYIDNSINNNMNINDMNMMNMKIIRI